MNIKGHKISVEVPYFTIDLSGHSYELDMARKAVNELRATEPGIDSNVKSVYASPYDSHKRNDKLQPLCRLVTKICGFVTENALGQKLDFSVVNCWTAVYEKNDFTVMHTHWPVLFSAVIYLESDEDSSPLILGNQINVPATKDTMVIFPGWLEHEVCETPTQRVVIAMNLATVFDKTTD
jgi:hypothetical protein